MESGKGKQERLILRMQQKETKMFQN